MIGPPLNHSSLHDFWKIPADAVLVNDVRSVQDGQVHLLMPAHDSAGKPGLYTWGRANVYAPVHFGGNGAVADISDLLITTCSPQNPTVTLPFNLEQAAHNLLYEKYLAEEAQQQVFSHLRRLYYRAKPLLPRFIQVALRRQYVDRQSHRAYPTWPVDLSVDLIYYQVMENILKACLGASFPMISFWPDGADFCLVLTHDIEQQAGLENIKSLAEIEKTYGFRSCWNFVPKRYPVDITLLNHLQSDGFEVGVHGLYHDGKLCESLAIFMARSVEINRYFQLWGCAGFRSPSNLRNYDWISKYIHAEYDSSGLSCELYGIQPGGSCTVFPFMINQQMVELPITLQQDFTLLDVLKLTPKETLIHWIRTVESIENIRGMALINTHPDYMNTPERLEIYAQFLSAMREKTRAWHALPQDVASWWRDRHNSALIPSNGSWRVQGPAEGKGKVMECTCEQGKLTIRPHRSMSLPQETDNQTD
jgi:hypothetical protein